ncbi:MAG: gamma-glutamyl-gamma-aminobutyrate hydrolase family protein [Nanoarchaeota archaeon]
MKILVINNGSYFLKELKAALKNHKVSIVDFNKVNQTKDFDKIILSGGHRLNVEDHTREYSNEIKIIKSSSKPILGICLGFELIGKTFGENLVRLEKCEKGILDVRLIKKNKIINGLNKFKVFEDHRWVLKHTKFMIPIAKSKDGIEIIKHPKKDIYGVQFHPEMFVDKTEGRTILNNFLNI